MAGSWATSESETARVSRILSRNAVFPEGERLLEKFLSSGRDAARLAIALRGYFLPEGVTESQKTTFLRYLTPRFRIAATALMELGQMAELRQWLELCPADGRTVDELLRSAVLLRRTEAAALLLRWKSEHFGFRDRDLSL